MTRAKSQFDKLKATSAEHKERATALKAEVASLKDLNEQLQQQVADAALAAPDAGVTDALEQQLTEARLAYSHASGQLEALTLENEVLRSSLAEAAEARSRETTEWTDRQANLERLISEIREEARLVLERAGQAEQRVGLLEQQTEDCQAELVGLSASRDDLLKRLKDTEGERDCLQASLSQAQEDAEALRQRAQEEMAEQARHLEAEAERRSTFEAATAASLMAEAMSAAEGRATEAEAKVAALKEKLGLAKQKFLKMQVDNALFLNVVPQFFGCWHQLSYLLLFYSSSLDNSSGA